jgi:hypothetical protein
MTTTKTPGPPSDPILAAIEALRSELRTELRSTTEALGRRMDTGFEAVKAGFAAVRGDIQTLDDELAVLRTDLELTDKKMDAGFAAVNKRLDETNARIEHSNESRRRTSPKPRACTRSRI